MSITKDRFKPIFKSESEISDTIEANKKTTRELSTYWWSTISSAGRTRYVDINPEIVGNIRRWESLSKDEIDRLYLTTIEPPCYHLQRDRITTHRGTHCNQCGKRLYN